MVPGPGCSEGLIIFVYSYFQVLALNLSLILTLMKIKIQFVSSDLTTKSYS